MIQALEAATAELKVSLDTSSTVPTEHTQAAHALTLLAQDAEEYSSEVDKVHAQVQY